MFSKKFQRSPLNATHDWHAIVKEATVRLLVNHRRKHTTCEAGDCAVHTYSVAAASSFMGKLQPFSYEARTEAC